MTATGIWPMAVSFERIADKTWRDSAIDCASHYFYFGGRKAYVIESTLQENGTVNYNVEHSEALPPSRLEKILKIASFFTVVIPLIAAATLFCLERNRQFVVIDPSQDGRLELPLELLNNSNLQQHGQDLRVLISRHLVEDFASFHSFVYHEKHPGILLKRGNDSMENTLATARTICRVHGFDHLVIPSSQQIPGKQLLAFERLSVPRDVSWQKAHYQRLSVENPDSLKPALAQLVHFIILSGFDDSFINIPLMIDESNNPVEPVRIALINLSGMNPEQGPALAGRGLFGNGGWKGLIHSLFSDDLVDFVCEEAQRHGISVDEAQVEARKREIAQERDLQLFYQTKGIDQENAKQPIAVGASLPINELCARSAEELRLNRRVLMKKTAKELAYEFFYLALPKYYVKDSAVEKLTNLLTSILKAISLTDLTESSLSKLPETISKPLLSYEADLKAIIKSAPHHEFYDESIRNSTNLECRHLNILSNLLEEAILRKVLLQHSKKATEVLPEALKKTIKRKFISAATNLVIAHIDAHIEDSSKDLPFEAQRFFNLLEEKSSRLREYFSWGLTNENNFLQKILALLQKERYIFNFSYNGYLMIQA